MASCDVIGVRFSAAISVSEEPKQIGVTRGFRGLIPGGTNLPRTCRSRREIAANVPEMRLQRQFRGSLAARLFLDFC